MRTILNYGETKNRSKTEFLSHFFYSRIHSRIFSSLNHKIRKLRPPKRRENSPSDSFYHPNGQCELTQNNLSIKSLFEPEKWPIRSCQKTTNNEIYTKTIGSFKLINWHHFWSFLKPVCFYKIARLVFYNSIDRFLQHQ